MEEIKKAVDDIYLALHSGDPTIACLCIYARASYGLNTRGPSLFCATQGDVERAEMRFEIALKAILKHYSPTTFV